MSGGPPRRKPPAGAGLRIERLAAEGWSMKGIARVFGTDHETLRRWLRDHADLQESFENGRERERHALHNALYTAAMNGQIAAAMFLLKARHGYREGDQSEQANRVAITFQLPGALKPEQFPTVEVEPHGAAAATPERISAPRA